MKIIVQNLATEYTDEGEGKIVLFLHGWKDNLHTFDSLISFLPPKWKIIRLDIPGFGQSEMQKETWDLDNYIHFVKDFIDKLNIEVYAFVAHSFGGRIVIKGIDTKKLKAEKIVLIGSAGIAKSRNFRNLFLNILAKIGKLLTYIPPLIFYKKMLRKKMYSFIGSDYLNTGKLKKTFLKIISEDLSVNAKNITIPALLIWGIYDKETPLEDGEKFSKLIGNSKLEVFEAGHLVHKEKTKEVAKKIEEFL